MESRNKRKANRTRTVYMPTSHQSSIATKDLSRAGYWRNNGKDISRMPHLAIYQYTHERPLAVSIIQRLLQ